MRTHGTRRATLAVCLFSDFLRDEIYLERAVQLFQGRIGFAMTEKRRFGGAGNVRVPETAVRSGLLEVGEAAGFQDPVAGFGIRAAIRSGHLAARAWLDGRVESFDRLWGRRLGGAMRAGVVNRYLYELTGDFGHRRMSRAWARAKDPRDWLRRRYAPSRLKDLVYPAVKHTVLRPFERPAECTGERCRCTWCRCVRGLALPEKAGISSRS